MTAEIFEFEPAFQKRRSKAEELTRIVHVDDDADIRSVVKMTLELVGHYDVLQCASGPEALSVAAGYKPQLLILDVMMPGMTGEQTFLELSKQPELEHVPAIFMTAKAERQCFESLMELGALSVIIKPFDPGLLCQEIESIWARYNEVVANPAQQETPTASN